MAINNNHIEEYKAKRSIYESFCTRLKSLLEEILSNAGVDFQSIECRTKTIESFSDKIVREEKNYTNPIEDITDLVGIRVILYYSDQVGKVADLIRAEFEVDEKNSSNKKDELAENEFGYLSIHQIISLNKKRKDLLEWKQYSKFKAEVQIRTILQHSWAAINHKLTYKTNSDIPSELRRHLYRLSGMLELADEQFVKLREMQQTSRTIVKEKLDQGDENLEINADSFVAYIKRQRDLQKLFIQAKKIGYTFDVTNPMVRYVSQAVDLLHKRGIFKISDFEKLIHEQFGNSELFLQKLFDAFDKKPWRVSDDFIVLMCLLFIFRDHIDRQSYIGHGWADSVIDKIFEVANSIQN